MTISYVPVHRRTASVSALRGLPVKSGTIHTVGFDSADTGNTAMILPGQDLWQNVSVCLRVFHAHVYVCRNAQK